MRDVSFKNTTRRSATARAELFAAGETLERVAAGDTPKGDPIPVAKVAAIQATKKTTEWIPYCHNIPIEHVDVRFEFLDDRIAVDVYVVSIAKTGVEMEAITAAAAAVITLYDMLKMIDETMVIGSIRLLDKTGGKSDLPLLGGWTASVIVLSDRASRGEYDDRSGPLLKFGLEAHGAADVNLVVLPDDADGLRQAVHSAVRQERALLIVCGGTGLGPHDITFDTLTPVLERTLPGVVDAFMQYSQARVPTAMLARPLAGLIENTLVLAIPGSPGAAQDALHALLPSLLHFRSILAGEGHP